MKKTLLITALFCASLSALAAQTPELFLQMGHSGIVYAVAYSPDGRRIATGSIDCTVKIWDAESGRELRTLTQTESVSAVSFSPDGKRLISNPGNIVKIWNVETGQEIRTLAGHSDSVMFAAYSPDGRRIVSASDDKTLKIWNAETGQEIRTLAGHTAIVRSASWSPDGRRIVSGSDDKTIKIWDAETGREIRAIADNDRRFNSVSFSPDGRRIVSSTIRVETENVKIWDAETGRELRAISTGNGNYVTSVQFSPDGKRIVCGPGNTVKIFDAETGRELRSLAGHSQPVRAAAYSPDGRRILSGSYDHTAKVWDASDQGSATGRELLTLGPSAAGVFRMAFSPSGKRLAAGSLDGALRIWDTESGRQLRIQRYGGQINSVHYSPDSTLLAFTVNDEKDKTVRIVNGETGAVVRSLSGHGGMVNYAAFSPDGRRIASASDDKTLKLWDAATGRELRTLSGHTEGVICLAFSADGKRLVSGSADKTIKIWDAETGREIKTISGPNDEIKHGAAVWSVAFSPDGTIIASASQDRSFPLWDIASGKFKRGFDTTNPVYYSMFSPDGKHLIAGQGNQVKIRDASNGRQVKDIDGFAGGVYVALYSPDGRWIAAACGDGAVRLLDAADYSPWFTLVGFTGEEWLTLLPQNYYYGSANGDRYLNARVGNTVSGADRYRQNLKSAALALGMRVSMDLAVQRFLEPNNRAAISRVEGRLQSIASGSNATRAEIESYLRAGIAEIVDTEFNKGMRGGIIPATVYAQWIKDRVANGADAMQTIKDCISDFYIDPTRENYEKLLVIMACYDDNVGKFNDQLALFAARSYTSVLDLLNEDIRRKIEIDAYDSRAALVRAAKSSNELFVFSLRYK